MPDPLADLMRLDGVPSAVAAARDAVDVVLRDRGLRSVDPDRRAAAMVAAAQASAALTGAADRWLPGALRLAAETVSLSALLRAAPGQVLARAHALAARDLVGSGELGRLRTEPEVIERVSGLSRLLTDRGGGSAVVLAAVAHAEVASVQPFGSADALVARAVERMVLVSGGVDPLGVIVVEVGHLSSGAYAERLAGYRSGGVAGVRDWILHCCRALTTGAEHSPVNPHGAGGSPPT